MDGVNEQEENLKGLIGFDPHIQQESSQQQKLSPLEKAATANGVSIADLKKKFNESVFVTNSSYRDTDNLFSILKYSPWETGRNYLRYNPQKEAFEQSLYTNILRNKIEFNYFGERNDRSLIQFVEDKIDIHRFESLDRIADFNFDEYGQLESISLFDYNSTRRFTLKREGDSFVIETQNYPGEQEYNIDENGLGRLTFLQSGRETDVLNFKTKINVSELKEKFNVDVLLKNPSIENINVDPKTVTPLQAAGINWQVNADR